MHTIDEVKSRYDAGLRLIFIDARTEEDWAKSDVQIPGSIRVPPDRAEEFAAAIPKGATIITYCTCPQESSSARVARVLRERGWRDVHHMFPGFSRWLSRGYPTEARQARPQTVSAFG